MDAAANSTVFKWKVYSYLNSVFMGLLPVDYTWYKSYLDCSKRVDRELITEALISTCREEVCGGNPEVGTDRLTGISRTTNDAFMPFQQSHQVSIIAMS